MKSVTVQYIIRQQSTLALVICLTKHNTPCSTYFWHSSFALVLSQAEHNAILFILIGMSNGMNIAMMVQFTDQVIFSTIL